MYDDTVYEQTYPTVTVRGRVQPDYGQTPEEEPITGVDVQPGVNTELGEHREASEIRLTVFIPEEAIPAGVTLHEGSIIRYGTRVYEVDGPPGVWGGALGHTVLLLSDWSPE